MKTTPIIALAVVVMAAGCAPQYGNQYGGYGGGYSSGSNQGVFSGSKKVFGGLGGAAAGGWAGSAIGKGNGKLAATAAGTLLGAFLGYQIGDGLDKTDEIYASQAESRARTALVGQPVQWSNPQNGNSGIIVPTREGHSVSGEYCREYQHTITVGGSTKKAYGQACQQQDGTWRIGG